MWLRIGGAPSGAFPSAKETRNWPITESERVNVARGLGQLT
jgi:hypothetical protein